MENQRNSTITLYELLHDSGLNEDCFNKICKYLTICDLLNIASLDKKIDNTFVPCLCKNVIKNQIVDTEQIRLQQRFWSVDDVFVHFGHSMKRLKTVLWTSKLDIPRKIVKFCRPNLLTELEIHFRCDRSSVIYTKSMICREKLPVFLVNLPNLRRLTIDCKLYCEYTGYLMFPNQLTNMTNMTNISELRIFGVDLNLNMVEFQLMLDRLLNLKVFVQTHGKLDIQKVADELARRYPNLHGFGYAIDYNTYGRSIDFGNDRFEFLKKFTNLTEIHLSGLNKYGNVHAVLRFVPKLKIFGIDDLYMVHLPVEIRRIMRSIKDIVKNRSDTTSNGTLCPDNDLIQMRVNKFQYNEFNVIKGAHNFIRMNFSIA